MTNADSIPLPIAPQETMREDVRKIAINAITEMWSGGASYDMCADWIAERVTSAIGQSHSPATVLNIGDSKGKIPDWLLPEELRSENYVPAATALRDIAAERQRQVSVEGWTPEHDDQHADGALAKAAAAYAFSGSLSKDVLRERAKNWWDRHGSDTLAVVKSLWPWAREWWKPKDQRHDLVRAGALIVAEIERLDRKALASRPSPPASKTAVDGRWYIDNIEESIRPHVKLLRENGFNTISSCEHRMEIDLDFLPDGEVKRLHDLLFDAGYQDYELLFRLEVRAGNLHTDCLVKFPGGDGSKSLGGFADHSTPASGSEGDKTASHLPDYSKCPERPPLPVQSANYWFQCARDTQYPDHERWLYMENAVNHLEGALVDALARLATPSEQREDGDSK